MVNNKIIRWLIRNINRCTWQIEVVYLPQKRSAIQFVYDQPRIRTWTMASKNIQSIVELLLTSQLSKTKMELFFQILFYLVNWIVNIKIFIRWVLNWQIIIPQLLRPFTAFFNPYESVQSGGSNSRFYTEQWELYSDRTRRAELMHT